MVPITSTWTTEFFHTRHGPRIVGCKTDPTTLGICIPVYVVFRIQNQQGITTSSFKRYKMVLARRDQGTRIGNLFLGGPRSRRENLCRNTLPHSQSTCRRVWSRLKEKVRGRVNRSARVDSSRIDEVDLKRSF
jgi:hypothetical protein